MTQQRTLTSAFDEAAAGYEKAMDAWYTASAALRDAQAQQREATVRLEDATAAARLDPRFDGKNAEERAANLRIIVADDAEYQAAQTALEEARQETQRWGDEATTARDGMALAKRQMDWLTAQLQYRAVKGGENRDSYDNRG